MTQGTRTHPRRLGLLGAAALLGVLAGCSGATTNTAPVPSSVDPDALLRAAVADYNDRNNVAIAAANANDPTKWKLADTGVVLESDVVGTVLRRLEAPAGPSAPFDFVAVRQLGVESLPSGGRWLMGTVRMGERGAATAPPANPSAAGASATPVASPVTTSPPSAEDRSVVLFSQAATSAPWLMQLHATLPASVGDLAVVTPASDVQQAAAVATVRAAMAYLSTKDISAGVDLGSMPAKRPAWESGSGWGAQTSAVSCAVDMDKGGAPLVRAVGTGQGVIAVSSFRCSYTLTFSKASKIPKLSEERKALWGPPNGAVLSIPAIGTVMVRIPPEGRAQVLWWHLEDGMAPAQLAAAIG